MPHRVGVLGVGLEASEGDLVQQATDVAVGTRGIGSIDGRGHCVGTCRA